MRPLIFSFFALSGFAALLYSHIYSLHDSQTRIASYGFTYAGRPVTGLFYGLHQNGSPSRLLFLWKGKKEFFEWQFYANGRRMIQRQFRQGRPTGRTYIWHADGRPKGVSDYQNGRPEGESWQWYRDGAVAKYTFYREGQAIVHRTWSPRKKAYENIIVHSGKRFGFLGDRNCDRIDLIR